MMSNMIQKIKEWWNLQSLKNKYIYILSIPIILCITLILISLMSTTSSSSNSIAGYFLIASIASICALYIYGKMNWMASLCTFIAAVLIIIFGLAATTDNEFIIGAEHKFDEYGWHIKPFIRGLE